MHYKFRPIVLVQFMRLIMLLPVRNVRRILLWALQGYLLISVRKVHTVRSCFTRISTVCTHARWTDL